MSKFKNVQVTGNGNIIGNSNSISNVKNTVINNNSNNNNIKGGDDPGIFIVGAIALGALGLMIYWKFFYHYETIHQIIHMSNMTSPILALVGTCVLLTKDQAQKSDLFKLLLVICTTILIWFAWKNNISETTLKIINLANNSDAFKFNESLSTFGQEQAKLIMGSTISMGIGSLLNHFVSFSIFSYSLANINKTGFWYGTYKLTWIFKPSFSGTLGILLGATSFIIVLFLRT